MMTIKINDEELEALDELPHMVRCVYLFGIRPYADYATGVAGGPRRRISYQSLAEAVYVPPMPGTRESFQASKQQLRRALRRLESTGAVEIQSEARQLILRLPLMETDQSAYKQADTRPTQGRHTQADTQADILNPHSCGDSEGKADTQADTRPTHPNPCQADIHPVSGIREDSPPKGGSSGGKRKGAHEDGVDTFIAFPLNDGAEHVVTTQDRDHWAALYPAVDVDQELRSMLAWLEANPSRRKTPKGIKRFITNWLSKRQDRGGSSVTRMPSNRDRQDERPRRRRELI